MFKAHKNTDGEPFWQPRVDEDLLMSSFDEKLIEEVNVVIRDYLKEGKGIVDSGVNYNLPAGNFEGRNDEFSEPLNEYFQRLLFAPNIAILDYVLRNYDEFKNYKFIDNACGIGTLSVFLKMLDIDCYNFDLGNHESNPEPRYGQINTEEITIHENILSSTGISISPITHTPPKVGDVVTCSGFWLSSPVFDEMNENGLLKYVMTDNWYNWKGCCGFLNEEQDSIWKRHKEYTSIKVFKKH